MWPERPPIFTRFETKPHPASNASLYEICPNDLLIFQTSTKLDYENIVQH